MENAVFDSCMERIRKGDREALREIYEDYRGPVYFQALSIVGNRQDAEDVSSEVFLKIFRLADQYRPGGGHKSWLWSITHNMSVDFLRKKNWETASESEEMIRLAGGREDDLERIEGEDTVARVLATLTPAEREVVHLKVIGDLTLKEISALLKAPMGTVAWRYRQAIGKLRRGGYGSGF